MILHFAIAGNAGNTDITLDGVTKMLINNFETIEDFMTFEPGTYYKFEALVRNTDGENPLYYEGISNVNKNILIKNWYVDSSDYYLKIKNEMKTLCDLTGARLYITLDKKSIKSTVCNLVGVFVDMMKNMPHGSNYTIKSVAKQFASCTSIKESSVHGERTVMWDIDNRDIEAVRVIVQYIKSKGQEAHVLWTKKGYHVFCYNKFNTVNWLEEALKLKYGTNETLFTKPEYSVLKDTEVKDNQLGLVYMNKEGN